MSLLTGLAVVLATANVWAVRPPPQKIPTIKDRGRDVPLFVEVQRAKLIGAKKDDQPAKTPVAVDGSKPRPAIKALEPTHDFGTVWVGPVLKHTFKIKNEGTIPLEITRVKPSCGCTIAGNYPRVIQPGETGDFPFSVNSKKLRNKFEKGITVTSTDPNTPTIRLRLRGEVKQYVDVSPASVYFGKITSDKRVERVVTITNNTEKPLEVELNAEPGGGVGAKLIEIEKGKKFELKVSYEPPFKIGVFRRSIILKTNVDAQKTVSIDVRGSVPERLEVSPAVITMGSRRRAPKTDNARPITRIVRLTNYGDKPVKLLEATADDDAIKVRINEQRPGKSYTIQIEFPAGYEVPATGRKITLKTDDPQKPTIEVPIKGLASRTKSKLAAKPRRRPAEELVGQVAPNFSLKTIDGTSVSTP